MTKNQKSSKAIHYRRCLLNPVGEQNLQQLVTSAISKFPKPADRYEPLNTQST